MKVYVIHENPDWFGPIGAALDAAGVPHEQWLLGAAALDLGAEPPAGVFWSRMSASSHTRDHPFAKDQTRGVLSWLAAHGRRVVNGRQALELEMSKVDQLVALRAAGFDVPRTIAVAGTAELAAAARRLPAPFVAKHNQGGKGLGVRLFASHDEFEAAVAGTDLGGTDLGGTDLGGTDLAGTDLAGTDDSYAAPVDGITLLQEYLVAARPQITRAEIVGGEFVYAITADTARGGFELCPADACAVDQPGAGAGPGQAAEPSLFALREGFEHPVTGRYERFAREHGIEIAGFEFIETADGRLVTYDINTTTNYNADIEAAAPRPAWPAVAGYLAKLLAETSAAAGHAAAAA